MSLPSLDEIRNALPNYILGQKLMDGGQKRVYRATHLSHGEVVIKFALSEGDARVIREIDIAKQHSFRSVPQMLESGSINYTEGDVIYIVEKFIEGESLRAYLETHKKASLKFVVGFLKTMLHQSVELEKHGVIHRDIKPENIIVATDGTFWLLDFGIARPIIGSTLTAPDAQFGPATPGYAPSEQFRNVRRETDIRADLFAIGVTAYEILVGENPFRVGAQNPLDVFRLTETLTPTPLLVEGDNHRQLSGFISVLMDRYPSRRPNTAVIALDWFESVLPSLELGSDK
jgi:eukaryotic-like serine/threonine-protein kinase